MVHTSVLISVYFVLNSDSMVMGAVSICQLSIYLSSDGSSPSVDDACIRDMSASWHFFHWIRKLLECASDSRNSENWDKLGRWALTLRNFTKGFLSAGVCG